VGNANSANDIAAQLAPVSDGPVYQSIRRPALPTFPSLANDKIRMVAPVSKYTLKRTPAEDGYKIDAQLTDGTTLSDLDSVQIGTGYRPLPKFIHVLDPSSGSEERKPVPILDENTYPHRIPALHRLIMYAHNPSLGFIGAPLAFTPFTIADVASTWLALAWRGETAYPETADGRLVFEKERLEAIEKWRRGLDNPSSLWVYSVLGPSEQEYAYGLRRDIVRARPALDKTLPVWSDERTKVRDAMYRTKFEALQYAKRQRDRTAHDTATGSQ
jgi:hypothetical protein